MAIKLTSKPDTIPAGGDYPYGDIRDRVGLTPGTPVSRQVYADFHQFFERIMAISGVSHNGLPDNDNNGWQLFEALIRVANGGRVQNSFTITQSGTSIPVITVFGDTILNPNWGTIFIERTGVGEYNFYPNGGITGAYATMLIPNSGRWNLTSTQTVEMIMRGERVYISTKNSGSPSDGILDNHPFIISELATQYF